MVVLAPPVQVVASGAPPFVQVPSGAPPFVVTTGPAPPITIVASGAPPITLFNADGSIWSAHTAAGGELLLTGESDGFATDFLHPVDAERVALKSSGSTLSYAVDAFYQQAGTSPKMVYDVAGTLGWSPHNLALQSAMGRIGFEWTGNLSTYTGGQQDPQGGNEALQVAVNPSGGPGAGNNVTQQQSTVSGVVYTGSMWLKGTAGQQIYFNGDAAVTASQVLVTFTGSWQRVSSTFTSASTVAYFGCECFNRGGGANLPAVTFQCWGAQFQRGSTATAYLPTTTAARFGLPLDYDPVTHAARGLLVEPAATNLVLQSAAGRAGFLWGGSGATLTGGQPDPSGGSEALQVVTTVNGGLNVNQTLAGLTNGTVYTFSMWCKGTAGQQIYLTDGTVAGQLLVTFTGAWQRVSKTITQAGTTAWIGFEIYNRTTPASPLPNVTFTIWGGQWETGTVATSPIPTLAASVTRAADQVNVTPASINYSATAGSWWAETYLLEGSLDRVIVGTNAGSWIPMYYNGAAYQIGLPQLYKLDPTVNKIGKAITAFQANDRAITSNGLSPPATDTNAATGLLAPTTIYIGVGNSASGTLGYIRKLRYLPRRPGNAELVSMTGS